MKFAEIIRESGVNPSDVPKAAELPIVLYDGKRREIKEETIHFAEPIFENNSESRTKFLRFVFDLERQLKRNWNLTKTVVLHVQITEVLLVVGSGVMVPYIFPRQP